MNDRALKDMLAQLDAELAVAATPALPNAVDLVLDLCRGLGFTVERSPEKDAAIAHVLGRMDALSPGATARIHQHTLQRLVRQAEAAGPAH